MVGVSFSNLHPDFKLGLLLVVATCFLKAGSSDSIRAVVTSGALDFRATQYGTLLAANGLGALFLVAAAAWMDRRPPQGMMAAGALVLALGFILVTLADGFGLAVAGMFLAGSGGAFVHPLIFYAVVVKGYARFKGSLIGALGMVFTVSVIGVGGGWVTTLPGWWFVALILLGGILLFLLLPRWFSGNYGPGPTLREAIDVPGAMSQIAWASAVYLFAVTILGNTTTQLLLATGPLGPDPEIGGQYIVLCAGIGALLWGVAADFLPVRGLLIALAVLSLPAAAYFWLLDDPAVGALVLPLVHGGLVSLPWVLMAESLPANHFAKLALPVTWLGLLTGSLGTFFWGLTVAGWGVDSFLWIVLVEAGLLAAVVASRPTLPETVTTQTVRER